MGTNAIISAIDVKEALDEYSSPERAKSNEWFFKTAEGQYGYGDVFVGVSVPDQRKVAKLYGDLSLEDLEKLLHSKVHEHRLTAVFILVNKYKKADIDAQKQIYEFYLNNMAYINNWDIVDSSASYVVGEFLYSYSTYSHAKSVLLSLSRSGLIWERRIAIMATFAYIYHGESKMTFEIAKVLLHDDHDLIQKAVGWMLREVGKRVSRDDEVAFLLEGGRYKTMPRTMLRYAIERFDEPQRQAFLKGNV